MEAMLNTYQLGYALGKRPPVPTLTPNSPGIKDLSTGGLNTVTLPQSEIDKIGQNAFNQATAQSGTTPTKNTWDKIFNITHGLMDLGIKGYGLYQQIKYNPQQQVMVIPSYGGQPEQTVPMSQQDANFAMAYMNSVSQQAQQHGISDSTLLQTLLNNPNNQQGKDNTTLYIAIGGGVFVLLMLVMMMNMNKKK